MSDNKKKYLPFGTPIHGKHPFSEYAHLSMENRQYAVEIATPAPPRDPKFAIELPPPTVQTKKVNTIDKPEVDSANKPCARPECKEVVRKIAEQQEKNMRERDHILGESKKLLEELEQTEQLLVMAEGEQTQLAKESIYLDKSLAQVGQSLDSLEIRKHEQQQERDELVNKVMMIETEKQKWVGRLQRAEEALAEMLWKGDSAKQPSDPEAEPRFSSSPIRFARRPRTSAAFSESTVTDYSPFVRPDIIDSSERPRRAVTSVGVRLPMSGKSFEGSQSSRITSRDLCSAGGGIGFGGSLASDFEMGMSRTFGSTTSSRSMMSGTGFPAMAPLRMTTPGLHGARQPLTSPVDGSLILALPKGAFKGYTPTGGNRHDGANSVASRANSPSSDLSSVSRIALDPVFYADMSRNSFGRKDEKGKVRVRHDPPGFRRKLLTVKGHPGIYTQGEFDDFSMGSVDMKGSGFLNTTHSME